MSILYRWLNDDKSIMSFIFHSHSTWDNFYNVLSQAFGELHTVNHPVDIIIDLSRLQKIPQQTIKELYYLSQLEHINFRYRLLISQNPLMHEVYNAFVRSYPYPSDDLHLCWTMEEAHLFIDLHTSTL
jgi:hypothetical protein